MEVAAERAVPPIQVSRAVDCAFWFQGDRVEPVGDICTGCLFDWHAEFCITVDAGFDQQFGHVEDIPEKGEPAVVGGVVESDFFGGVVPADFERFGYLFGLTFGEAGDG